ncbi:hypothetical protein SDC9_187422 [bioreactor metagenome]|uniref:Ankyrin repeat domain-containing protein n=1 Tax=bioreactor metagenome TaxID=1076179 RepID=A0A645HLJ3_9ZZZZ
MVTFLIAQGADPNLQEQTGLTPLHWAASHGNLDTVKVLIAGGAAHNVANSFGQSAAALARAHRNWEIAEFLDAL